MSEEGKPPKPTPDPSELAEKIAQLEKGIESLAAGSNRADLEAKIESLRHDMEALVADKEEKKDDRGNDNDEDGAPRPASEKKGKAKKNGGAFTLFDLAD